MWGKVYSVLLQRTELKQMDDITWEHIQTFLSAEISPLDISKLNGYVRAEAGHRLLMSFLHRTEISLDDIQAFF